MSSRGKKKTEHNFRKNIHKEMLPSIGKEFLESFSNSVNSSYHGYTCSSNNYNNEFSMNEFMKSIEGLENKQEQKIKEICFTSKIDYLDDFLIILEKYICIPRKLKQKIINDLYVDERSVLYGVPVFDSDERFMMYISEATGSDELWR